VTLLHYLLRSLVNRSFYVNIDNCKSSVFQLLCGVLQRSSLVFFSLYNTRLFSVLSFNSATNHHLYADDTQLFLSFSAGIFSCNITHLANTIANVANWISSYILIFLKLSLSSLVYQNDSLNSIILPIIYLTMSYSHLLMLPAILVSSHITICHFHNISLLFPNHAFTVIVT